MDETEKYQQRLQAIAEKRRLQEEQEKAKREMEEERLRLQQLKRKSLRDQWLMEGPPLSPSSPDSQTPTSPLWGAQAQAIEQHIDKLETESQRLVEEEGKLQEQLAEGQTEARKVAKAVKDAVQETIAENGLEEGSASGEAAVEENLIQPMNGKQEEEEANHNTPGENGLHSTNGPPGPPDASVTMTFLGFTETTPSQDEEEEEGILVMRAERVIITDYEGDELADDLSHRGAAVESTTWSPGEGEEGECDEDDEDAMKAETASETSTELKTELGSDQAPTAAVSVDVTAGEGAEAHGDGTEAANGDTSRKGKPQPQSQTDALEGAAVVSVPVYSEAQPTVAPRQEAEGEAVLEDQGPDAALAAQTLASHPGQFQEVSLAEPQEAKRTEVSAGEQEPLLHPSKAPPMQTESPIDPLTSETQTSPKATQARGSVEPKHKSCQCCSVM